MTAVFSSADATPLEIKEDSEDVKKLGTFDKLIGKLSYYISKHAPLIVIGILVIIVAALYFTGSLAI